MILKQAMVLQRAITEMIELVVAATKGSTESKELTQEEVRSLAGLVEQFSSLKVYDLSQQQAFAIGVLSGILLCKEKANWETGKPR